MSYPAKLVQKAQEIIDNRKFENERVTDSHYVLIRERLPRAAWILTELANTISKLSNLILAHDENISEKIEILKNENLALQTELAEILKCNGYPEDYLDYKYTCNICNDSGFTTDGRCECFMSLLKQLASTELSASLNMGLTSFDNFSLVYYSDKPLAEFKGISARAIMEKNLECCKKYANDFHLPNYCGILMSGPTGLGKTHLSLSIAKEVIEKGYSVVYGSVPDLFSKIEAVAFGRSDDNIDAMQSAKECDLLILDDLGAEFDKQFNLSCLYDIINSRINTGKPTIVSTNLTSAELKRRYTDRIASRLLSMKCLLFTGEDIRIKLNKGK